MKIMRLVKYDLFALLSIRKLLGIILLFVLIGLVTQKDLTSMASFFKHEPQMVDTLLSFMGPDQSGFGMGLIKWFLIQAVLVYLVGKMLDLELRAGRCIRFLV